MPSITTPDEYGNMLVTRKDNNGNKVVYNAKVSGYNGTVPGPAGYGITGINQHATAQANSFKDRVTPANNDPYVPRGGTPTIDTSYLDALLAQIEGSWDAQKAYIDAQNQAAIKKISDAYDERYRKQQALYNRNRRDILRTGRFGGMNGAVVAGLTNAGNTNNNAITAIDKDKAQSMSDVNVNYLGNLANLERDKNNYKLQLYKQYL